MREIFQRSDLFCQLLLPFDIAFILDVDLCLLLFFLGIAVQNFCSIVTDVLQLSDGDVRSAKEIYGRCLFAKSCCVMSLQLLVYFFRFELCFVESGE